jgi:hypothetical protein
MPTISFGPLTGTLTGPLGGPGNQALVFDTGQTAQIISSGSLSAASSVAGYSGSSWAVVVDWYDASDVLLSGALNTGTLHYNTDPTASLSGSAPAGATRAAVYAESALNSPDIGSITLNGSFTTTTYCGYGTQVQTSLPGIVTLLPNILLTIFGAVTDGWGAAAIGFFAGQTLNLQNLCGSQRVAAVELTAADFIAMAGWPVTPLSVEATQKFWQWLLWAAWPYFCECVPGSPSPTSPPVVIQPPPTGVRPGPPVAISCTNNDLCSTLNSLALQLNALAQMLVTIRATDTLIQRQSVPFAYVPGTVHSGLSGTGTITVTDVLGLKVDSTSIPGYLSSNMAPVPSYFRLGELSMGTVDGWTRRVLVTHDPHLFLDIDGDIDRVGYLFELGVVATITELVREP